MRSGGRQAEMMWLVALSMQFEVGGKNCANFEYWRSGEWLNLLACPFHWLRFLAFY